jgi:MFS transporter, DHA2 family, methylenomycin A resistance protein
MTPTTTPNPPAIHASNTADRRAPITLAAAVLGFFVITLDAMIVNVALPSVRASLGGGITGLEWVVDGYTLMFAALLLSAGALSDRVGARRAFGLGLVVFVAASAACGLAPNLGALVAARFVQGGGAAVVMPASMTLIRHAYPDAIARGRAIAVWAMGGAVASTAGPFVGGLLCLASWRWIFLINLPVGILTLALLARAAHSPRHRVPFDGIGQATGMLAIGGLTYAAIEAGAAGLTADRVLIAVAGAVLAGAGFLLAERRVEHPMVPLELFRSRGMNIAVAVGFAFMVGYYGIPFLMSLYLQQARGLSSLTTGVVFVPMMLIGLIVTPFSARIVERTGPRAPIAVGLFSLAAGAVALGGFTTSAPVWVSALLLIAVGLAGPLVMPPMMAVLLDSVPAHRAGTASGVFNTSRQIGGALAIAVFGALLAAPPGLVHGLYASVVVVAVVAVAAALVSLMVSTTARSSAPRSD